MFIIHYLPALYQATEDFAFVQPANGIFPVRRDARDATQEESFFVYVLARFLKRAKT